MINILSYLLAVFLPLGRGYVLVYLIDREKQFNFGFKFFVAWVLGLCGMTVDAFGFLILMDLQIGIWALVINALMQIIGFELVIFLFEKKLLLPQFGQWWRWIIKQVGNLKQINLLNETITCLIIITAIYIVISGGFSVGEDSMVLGVYDQLVNRQPLISEASIFIAHLGSSAGNFSIFSNQGLLPLNDQYLTNFVAIVAFDDNLVIASRAIRLLYLVIFCFIFYFALPPIKRFNRLLFLLTALLFYVFFTVTNQQLLFTLLLLISFAGFYNFLTAKKGSYYYLSGIIMALLLWTSNAALAVFFPLLLTATIIFYLLGWVKTKDFILMWFFTSLTCFPWLQTIATSGLRLNWQDVNWQFLTWSLWPVLLFLLAFQTQPISVKIKPRYAKIKKTSKK